MMRLNYLHVGGRNATYPLPLPPSSALAGDVDLVFFDADVDCLDTIGEYGRTTLSRFHSVRILPHGLGRENGRVPFHRHYIPHASSIYRVNPEFINFSFFEPSLACECVSRDIHGVLEVRDINLTTLDTLCSRGECPPPDILTLDVQGAEGDVLMGAMESLSKHTLAIQFEAAFAPLYSGQMTFGDILSRLSEIGLDFVGFAEEGAAFSPIALPVGWRAAERTLLAEAVFFRNPDRFAGLDDVRRAERLSALALVSLLYGRMGFCLTCLREAERCRPGCISDPQGEFASVGDVLLARVWAKWIEEGKVMPPLITDVIGPDGFPYGMRGGSVGHPERLRADLPALRSLMTDEWTELEKILLGHSLNAVAERLRKNRRQTAESLMRLARDHGIENDGTV